MCEIIVITSGKGGVGKTLFYGAYEVKYWIDITLQSLKMLVKGQVGVKDMSGPVGVVDMIGETYTESVQISWYAVFINMLNIAILLSVSCSHLRSKDHGNLHPLTS